MQVNEQELKQVMADVFGVGIDTINESSSVDTVPSWDSLKHLNLVLALEGKFNVTFSEEQTIEILSYPLIKVVLKELGVDFNKEGVS